MRLNGFARTEPIFSLEIYPELCKLSGWTFILSLWYRRQVKGFFPFLPRALKIEKGTQTTKDEERWRT